jgi:hypothetical protein
VSKAIFNGFLYSKMGLKITLYMTHTPRTSAPNSNPEYVLFPWRSKN